MCISLMLMRVNTPGLTRVARSLVTPVVGTQLWVHVRSLLQQSLSEQSVQCYHGQAASSFERCVRLLWWKW